ncbi:hypothetical protein BV22DRAFT_1195134 [Leucogyrophana mollusca]|uniref:Uncharacterized protein n=1 Tax=Leucogyrophana mollusca TaxID=85980 RepID=A0ACB8BI42_9AGAM|nr:hypothetical protein BV22DRAFT_1195134 [Leucogyrophana mollusca]
MYGMKHSSRGLSSYACLLIVFSSYVSAAPISSSTGTRNRETYVPLIITSLVFFLMFSALSAIKIVYMKHRRIGTIHAPNLLQSSIPPDFSSDYNSRSSLILNQCRTYKGTRTWYKALGPSGFLVGCFGSPTWETRIKSKIDKEAWRRHRTSSLGYKLHQESQRRSSRTVSINNSDRQKGNPRSDGRLTRSVSFFSFSSDQNSSNPAGIETTRSSRTLAYPPKVLTGTPGSSVSRRYSALGRSAGVSRRVGDFGENIYPWDDSRVSVGRNRRHNTRTTTSWEADASLRLVKPTEGTNNPFSFLLGCPPDSAVTPPLTSTRDSLQFPRSYNQLLCKPLPLPPLPASFTQPVRGDGVVSTESRNMPIPPHLLPPLHFSPTSGLSDFPSSPLPNQTGATGSVFDLSILPSNTHETPTETAASPTSEDTEFIQPRPLSISPGVPNGAVSSSGRPTRSNLAPKTPPIFAIQKLAGRKKSKSKTSHISRSGSGAVLSASPLRSVVLPEGSEGAKENACSPAARLANFGAIEFSESTPPNDHGAIHPALHPLSPSSYSSTSSPRPISAYDSGVSALKVAIPRSRDSHKSAGTTPTLRTPRSDQDFAERFEEVDIKLLGLDRFHWSEEVEEAKTRSSHAKKDSMGLISFWEEGGWLREHERW